MKNTLSRKQLVRLSDTNLTLVDAALDVRERKVFDSTGREIGQVEDVFIDDKEREVRFLEVATGGLLGLCEAQFLIPVEAIAGLRENAVVINQPRERIVEAPSYNPELIPERYYEDIYCYYGYAPYWYASYIYANYPL